MQHHPESKSRPFLKWAGGKQRLLSQILPLVQGGERLIEPFVGAGAVFLASDHKRLVLNDLNADLIAVWSAVQSRPRDLIAAAQELFSEAHRSPEAYLALRQRYNSSQIPFERAVAFVYLNRFGFNGLSRYNKAGAFNVPYGHPKALPRLPVEHIERASRRLTAASLMTGHFRAAIAVAGEGDVVYCDPPYSASSVGASFVTYTADAFGRAEHEELVACAKAAVKRGARVLISNHDTAETRELYQGFSLNAVQVRRSIAASAGRRGEVAEVVAMLAPS